MERFILTTETNKTFTQEIKNFFMVKNEKIIDNMHILFLNNISLEDVIHTTRALTVDLLLENKVYISGSKTNLMRELEFAIKGFSNLDNGIYLAPQLLTQAQNKKEALKILLDKYYDDHNFMELLNTFFNNNLNVVVSASLLYMHRNTLLYKINAFYEYTGFNVKNFKDAAVLYMSLCEKNSVI